ncbi:Type 1 glutamine amidotransferase-like domain-containing protein [Streptomyces salinarius]|uniref:Type 1 glutamine amidotransferase-like domain-containing protein n=1 Tax=Streptomyces salinarius TaxID=2762598 RepID=UPI0028528AC0|nr:Type 1 glutamine amidotransferase-like domain-containing protein [Streptomyces salinarius]
MTTDPKPRLALLGGGFSDDEDGLLDDWLLDQVPVPRPKVCFVPTASGDAPAYVERFLAAFQPRSCEPAVLPLFRRELDSEQGRMASYRAVVASRALPSGWALEDGVGALFTEGRLTDSVTRLPRARVYRVEPDGQGGAEERAVPCRLLLPPHQARSLS